MHNMSSYGHIFCIYLSIEDLWGFKNFHLLYKITYSVQLLNGKGRLMLTPLLMLIQVKQDQKSTRYDSI